MREDRPSFTSMAVAGMRAIYSDLPEPLGKVPDPLALGVLPFPFVLPARLVERARDNPKAAMALHHAYGVISAGLTYHVALRTRAIDDALRDSVAHGVEQIVLLGAGLDGRAYRLPELAGCCVYEVDHPSTQRDKRERVARTNLRSIAEIVFVPVDFEKDSLEQSLLRAGFSRDVPSFWIWEGVTMYLSRDAVQATLHAIANASAPGSRVAMTYARPPSTSAGPARPFVYRGMRALIHAGSKVLGRLGESVRNFMDSSDLNRLATGAGFVLVSDEHAAIWANRYWAGESPGLFEWERLAVLERMRN